MSEIWSPTERAHKDVQQYSSGVLRLSYAVLLQNGKNNLYKFVKLNTTGTNTDKI